VHPVTHLLASWTVANAVPLSRRDRAIVTVAGVIPDLDGLGLVVEQTTWSWDKPLYWYSEYHHTLAHNLGFALVVTAVVAILGARRAVTSAMVFAAIHLHLLGDLVGSRGPDGYQWPIPYLEPFSDRWQLTWQGQWVLNAWPNVALTVLLLALTLYWTWKRGRSPVELISRRADAALVLTLRRRFGIPRAGTVLEGERRVLETGCDRDAGHPG